MPLRTPRVQRAHDTSQFLSQQRSVRLPAGRISLIASQLRQIQLLHHHGTTTGYSRFQTTDRQRLHYNFRASLEIRLQLDGCTSDRSVFSSDVTQVTTEECTHRIDYNEIYRMTQYTIMCQRLRAAVRFCFSPGQPIPFDHGF